MTEHQTQNDLDNDLITSDDDFMTAQWMATHLLAIIIYLEDRFGPIAGEHIANIAHSISSQLNEENEPE